jgi:hypothetical protein
LRVEQQEADKETNKEAVEEPAEEADFVADGNEPAEGHMDNLQNRAKWWTADRIFGITLGFSMAAAFGVSFFAPQGSHTGSALVPASTLQKLIDNGGACQTITDDDVYRQTPPKRC